MWMRNIGKKATKQEINLILPKVTMISPEVYLCQAHGLNRLG